MSKKWWIVFGVLFGSGWVAVIVGIKLYGADSVLESLISERRQEIAAFATSYVR